MAVITVPPAGAAATNAVLNDSLQPDPSVDINSIPIFYELNGNTTLQSLFVGYDIEVDNNGALTGTGSVTGASDATVGNLPLLDNFAAFDLNGTIGVEFFNDGTVTTRSGERLDLQGDMLSFDGMFTVAAGGELDLDSPRTAFLTAIDVEGTLRTTGPSVTLGITTGSAVNNGLIDVAAGSLTVASDLQGTGKISVESGATLAVTPQPNTTAAEAVSLAARAALQLMNPSLFTGTIAVGGIGATIDLENVSAASASVSGGRIVVSGGTLSFAETGLTDGATINAASDSSGGSLLTVATLAPSSSGGGSSSSSGSGSAPGQSTQPSLPVYRFFDRTHGTQFFTSSAAEDANVLATRPDLSSEGVGLLAVNPANNDPNAAPVYRFFDTAFGTHFYTASATERDTVLATRPDLSFEGVGFSEDTTQQTGDVPVYRFFEQANGTHFYTASAAERANILATRPDLVSEGIGFYAPSS